MKKLITICLLVAVNSTLTAQTAEKYYELGHKYFLEKRGDSAMYYITKAIKANQKYAPPYRDAGQMLFNGKQYENAYLFLNIYETLNKESNKEDENYYYWYMKGFLIVNQGYENNRAVDYFNKSLKYKEDYYKTHKELMDLLVFSDPEKAIYHYTKVKELNKNFSVNDELDFFNKITEGYLKVENFAKAIESYERVKELDNNFAANEIDFFNKMAEGYLRANNFTKAIEYYEKIMATKPDDINLATKIALIYKDNLKDKANAEIRLKKILEKSPQEEAVIIELAELYYSNEEFNEAMNLLYKITPKLMDFGSSGSKNKYSNREYCVANFYLTRIYIDKKDKQKATETLQNMRNFFGLQYDNILNSYNDLLDVVKVM